MASSSAAMLGYTLCILCICSQLIQVTEATAPSIPKCPLPVQFYTHEIREGPNTTVYIAAGTNEGGGFNDGKWGSVFVFENMIYDGASPDSQRLGTVTGTTVLTTKAGFPVQFIGQFIFEAGRYNGSSFTVLPGDFAVGTSGFFQGYSGYGRPVDITVAPTQPLHVYLWTLCFSKTC